MQNLAVTVIQTELFWEDPEKNHNMFSEIIDSIQEETDIIILPEMFTTGFTMNAPELAEKSDGKTLEWMINKAVSKNADLTGSVIIEENDAYFNRLFWVRKDGSYEIYDKRHLFRMAGEHNIYSSGVKKIVVEVNGWRICPFVCYDLRFPVWLRNGIENYDLAVFVANWPEKRSQHWRLLLQARAIENQAFVVGVNRVGTDGLGIHYRGDSSIIDPLGNIIKQEANKMFVHTEVLQPDRLKSYRTKFPVWMDRDNFNIE